jgi:hypothetical protein
MEENLKQLLLIDLSARLPYGVKGIITYNESNITFTIEGIDNNVLHLSDAEECYVEDFKPYLRPMSSMTEDKKKEYELLANHCIVTSIGFIHLEAAPLIDWLNTHHFDYRGLIEKGIALEAPEGMYN